MHIDPLFQPLVVTSEIPEAESSHKRQRTVQSQVTSAATEVFDNQTTLPLFPKPLAVIKGTPKKKSPIALAVLRKEWSEVRRLLKANSKFSANSKVYLEQQWTSILTVTAASGEWSLVSLMIEKDRLANTNPRSKDNSTTGRTPLFYAMTNEQWDLVRQMIRCDRQLRVCDDSEIPGMLSPLFYVMLQDQWDLALLMLEGLGYFPLNKTEAIGPLKSERTPVWYAADKEKWDVVSLMLNRCSFVNLNASPPETPLQGRTILWLTVAGMQWNLAKKMVLSGMSADIYAAPVEEPDKGVPVWRLVVESKQWDLAACMLEKYFIAKLGAGMPYKEQTQLKTEIYKLLHIEFMDCSDEIKKILVGYLILENIPHAVTRREYVQGMLTLKSNLQKGLKSVSNSLIRL